MHESELQHLQSDLLRAGIAPRHVQRTVRELQEHMDDLVSAAIDAGNDVQTARRQAAEQMGDWQHVAIAMRDCPELRCWSLRFPRLAVLVYPLACLLVLPAMPVLAGVAHASLLVRWAACVVLGGLATASIFLLMQLSIALA